MKWADVIWIEGGGGNIEHVEANGVAIDEVEYVLQTSINVTKSRMSGLPIAFGYTKSGRYLAVVYKPIDDLTVYPVTAYDVED